MKRHLAFLLTLIIGLINSVSAQCPDIITTTTNPNCIPSCELCSGESITITLTGGDLPNGGKINYYYSDNFGFNPYSGEGTYIGFSMISTPNPPCRICPSLVGLMIDACGGGAEADNEFFIVWTGSGFNTSDLNFTYDPSNSAGAGNGHIGGGSCSLTAGNAGLIQGCAATPVGGSYNLPANAILVVFTSSAASTSYDFGGVCGTGLKIFVAQSTCDRSIGAFSNVTSTGLRNQTLSIDGCGCSSSAQYDTDDPSLMGDGDTWAGGVGNDGCAAPGVNAPSYTPAPSTISPFVYKIPDSWCDKDYEIVGIIDPKPDPMCCGEEFTERILISVRCPKAKPTTIRVCENQIGNGTGTFTLSDGEDIILDGSIGTVQWFRDMAGNQPISSPYTTVSTTVYAQVVSGKCKSALVPVMLEVIKIPKARATFDERCDMGNGEAEFPLDNLINTILNGNSGTVKFYEDINATIEITPPYTSKTKTIYAVIDDGECTSKPVDIRLVVLDRPKATPAAETKCDEGGGFALFQLTNLDNGIGGSGKTITYYEDPDLLMPIVPPYKTQTKHIFAVVSDGKCDSEPVDVYLRVINLLSIPLVSDKMCDNGMGQASFDLVDIKKQLTGGDTSVLIKWFNDSLLTMPINPPIIITVKDTIYAQISKDSCKSLAIPIILESVKRPAAKSVSIILCADSTGRAVFDLSLLVDTINGGDKNLFVIFAQDSSLKQLVNGKINTNKDTLWAATIDGQCFSIPVQVFLEAKPGPQFFTPFDTTVCGFYILTNILGNQLSSNAAYYSLDFGKGKQFQAGDTIKQAQVVYLFDKSGTCDARDSFDVLIDIAPDAGLDNVVTVCEGNIVDLRSVIRLGDPNGTFIDPANTGSLNQSFFNTSGKSGSTFAFEYIVSSNSSCPDDTATLGIKIVMQVEAGRDTIGLYCEGDKIDLSSLLNLADVGGKFSYLPNDSILSNNIWDSNISGPGSFLVQYKVGDGFACPVDSSKFILIFQEKIQIDHIDTLLGCGYVVLPDITGKNVQNNTVYSSLPLGQGINFQAGDTIRNTGLIYLFGYNQNFCPDEDSIYVNILASVSSNFIRNNLCSRDSFLIGGQYFSKSNPSGIVTLKQFNSNCDSIVSINLLYLPDVRVDFKPNACPGEIYSINGSTYSEQKPSGTEILTDQNGCDSTVVIQINYIKTNIGNYSASICPNESIVLNGKNYNASKLSGMDTIKGGSIFGCDSIFQVNLQLKNIPQFNYRDTICESDSVTLGGIQFDKNNSQYRDTIPGGSMNGCDSIISISFYIKPEINADLQSRLCENQFLTINGTRYDITNPSGIERFPSQNNLVCDSILHIKLFFDKAVASNYTSSLCNGDSVMVNNKYYSAAKLTGNDTLYGQSAGGCDSIVFVRFNLLQQSSYFIRETLCEGEDLIINGTVFNVDHPSGTVQLKNGARNGCDSTITINLDFVSYQIQYTKSLTIAPGQSVKLDVSTTMNPTSIEWIPSIGLSCDNCLNPEAAPTQNTSYQLRLVDSLGCEILINIQINVKLEDDVYIPNIFSPNGDNINDHFKVFSQNPNAIITNFVIYDRWGEQVFRETDVSVQSHTGWNGLFHGSLMNPGVYVYLVQIEIPGIGSKTLSGDMTLVR